MRTFDFEAVVIGGGAAGLTAAGLAANLGAKAMLVKKTTGRRLYLHRLRAK